MTIRQPWDVSAGRQSMPVIVLAMSTCIVNVEVVGGQLVRVKSGCLRLMAALPSIRVLGSPKGWTSGALMNDARVAEPPRHVAGEES